MWELDCEESWLPKNWCCWTAVLEKTLESPLDCKEIQPVHSEGDQPWDFFGRNDAKAEAPVVWPSHAKSWLIGKYSEAGRDWGQEDKGATEDEMAGWHHWLDGGESEWTLEVGDGQGGLACWDSWGHKGSISRIIQTSGQVKEKCRPSKESIMCKVLRLRRCAHRVEGEGQSLASNRFCLVWMHSRTQKDQQGLVLWKVLYILLISFN